VALGIGILSSLLGVCTPQLLVEISVVRYVVLKLDTVNLDWHYVNSTPWLRAIKRNGSPSLPFKYVTHRRYASGSISEDRGDRKWPTLSYKALFQNFLSEFGTEKQDKHMADGGSYQRRYLI